MSELSRLFKANARDRDRLLMWPIRLRWSDPRASNWFGAHGWQVGTERCAVTSFHCIPGYRRVFGWTFHVGRLKVCFGTTREEFSEKQHPGFA